MTEKQFKDLIKQVTTTAYDNVTGWMGKDPDTASQLRDGIRTVLDKFDEIEFTDCSKNEVLMKMLHAVDAVLQYYRSLPGEQGTWECSAVNRIYNELHKRGDLRNDTKKD